MNSKMFDKKVDIKIIINNSKIDKIFNKLLNLCIKYGIQLFNQLDNVCYVYKIEYILNQCYLKQNNIIEIFIKNINNIKK